MAFLNFELLALPPIGGLQLAQLRRGVGSNAASHAAATGVSASFCHL